MAHHEHSENRLNVTPAEARQAVKSGRMRYVLSISLATSILALIVIYLLV